MKTLKIIVAVMLVLGFTAKAQAYRYAAEGMPAVARPAQTQAPAATNYYAPPAPAGVTQKQFNDFKREVRGEMRSSKKSEESYRQQVEDHFSRNEQRIADNAANIVTQQGKIDTNASNIATEKLRNDDQDGKIGKMATASSVLSWTVTVLIIVVLIGAFFALRPIIKRSRAEKDCRDSVDKNRRSVNAA